MGLERHDQVIGRWSQDCSGSKWSSYKDWGLLGLCPWVYKSLHQKGEFWKSARNPDLDRRGGNNRSSTQDPLETSAKEKVSDTEATSFYRDKHNAPAQLPLAALPLKSLPPEGRIKSRHNRNNTSAPLWNKTESLNHPLCPSQDWDDIVLFLLGLLGLPQKRGRNILGVIWRKFTDMRPRSCHA